MVTAGGVRVMTTGGRRLVFTTGGGVTTVVVLRTTGAGGVLLTQLKISGRLSPVLIPMDVLQPPLLRV